MNLSFTLTLAPRPARQVFWKFRGTLLKLSGAPSRLMSSDWIESQPVYV